MMSNVEKRNQLMSPADKRYHGFIQETIDRISRMKELKQQLASSPKPNNFRYGSVPRSHIPIDLHLKKGE